MNVMIPIVICNIIVMCALIYGVVLLKVTHPQGVRAKIQIGLGVLALAGLFLSFGKNIIYLLISGAIALMITRKNNQQNGTVKMDK